MEGLPKSGLRTTNPAVHAGIAIEGLYKSFGDKVVLAGMDFAIQRGETIVIIGRSGVGKSVLLKLIVRLLEADAGKVWVDGVEVGALSREELFLLRRRFGMLFQGAALFDSMSICENVGLALREHERLSDLEIRASACQRLAMVGLRDAEDKLPSELSGGMKKRAGLARAIIMEPDYILYDEPTTGLDPITADAINDLILELQEKLKVTSIVVTHDMASAFKIADRIAMLNEGKIVYAAPVEEVRRTENPLVRQFIEGSASGPLRAF
jgi:phospholipid/cholesterol/gamma-HCH transport system ATP-binding protein